MLLAVMEGDVSRMAGKLRIQCSLQNMCLYLSCRALLRLCRALLRLCRALLKKVYNALFKIYFYMTYIYEEIKGKGSSVKTQGSFEVI